MKWYLFVLKAVGLVALNLFFIHYATEMMNYANDFLVIAGVILILFTIVTDALIFQHLLKQETK